MGIPFGYVKKEVVGYRALHKRLEIARGKAKYWNCVDCGEVAAEYSLETDGEYEQDGKRYSLELMDYSPRCRACHRRFDDNPPPIRRAVEQ